MIDWIIADVDEEFTSPAVQSCDEMSCAESRAAPLPDDVRDPALGCNTFQRALKTFVFSEYTSFPSALEVFHDYALYKFTIDIDIDIVCRLRSFRAG